MWGYYDFKKKLIFLLILLALPLISSVKITDTTFIATSNNYTIFINNSIIIDKVEVIDTAINLYNLTGGGNFTNTNDTYNAVLSVIGVVSPNDDVRWDNGTIISNDITNANITITPNRAIEIGDFPTPTPKPVVEGGGAGAYKQNPKEVIIDAPDIWTRNSEVNVFINVINFKNTTYKPKEIQFNFNITGVKLDNSIWINNTLKSLFLVSENAQIGNHSINVIVKDEKTINKEINFRVEEEDKRIIYKRLNSQEKKMFTIAITGICVIFLLLFILILVDRMREEDE